jgi:glycine oxidase
VIQVDVRRFVEGYAGLARARGARIRAGVAVRRFLVEGRRATGVETSAGVIRADCVVNCAGSWAGFDGSLPFAVSTIPARGQLLQLATAEPLVKRVVHSPRGYLVQRSDTELIAGTTVEHVGFDTRVTEEGLRVIREGVAEFSSATRSLPVSAQWAGLRPDTPDHLPILGRSPVEGLLLAAGHFRNGVVLAPLTGRIIADLALRGESPADLSVFSVTRFLAKRETSAYLVPKR